MKWLKWLRFPYATITRMTFLLLLLFIVIELMIIWTFRIYVVDPVAEEFVQIISESLGAGGTGLPGLLLTRLASDTPGSKPQNYFLTQARNDLRSHGGDLRITPHDLRNGYGILWIKRSAFAKHWTGFVIFRPKFDVDYFSILRLLAVGIIGFFGVAFVVARINRPLSRLAKQAKTIGYSTQPTDFVTSGGPKEVVEVERAMRRMAVDLHRFHEEREVLLTSISHELRTPLARLVLTLELPDDMLLQQKAEMLSDLTEMDQSLATCLAFIRSDGREQVVISDICSLLDEMAELGATRYDLAITWVRPKEPVLVAYRPLTMERLARNLLDNAHRYGAHVMEIKLIVLADQVRILFHDDGPGLHVVSGQAQNIAAPQPGQGSGVGIMLCQKIAALHGGQFTVMNGQQGGLEACLTLPLPEPA